MLTIILTMSDESQMITIVIAVISVSLAFIIFVCAYVCCFDCCCPRRKNEIPQYVDTPISTTTNPIRSANYKDENQSSHSFPNVKPKKYSPLLASELDSSTRSTSSEVDIHGKPPPVSRSPHVASPSEVLQRARAAQKTIQSARGKVEKKRDPRGDIEMEL